MPWQSDEEVRQAERGREERARAVSAEVNARQTFTIWVEPAREVVHQEVVTPTELSRWA